MSYDRWINLAIPGEITVEWKLSRVGPLKERKDRRTFRMQTKEKEKTIPLPLRTHSISKIQFKNITSNTP